MVHRPLYVAAYDISDPRRLRAALEVLKGYATGGQKSVFECYLSDAERQSLLAEIAQVIEPSEDSFLLVRLDPRSQVRTLGVAIPPEDLPFFYFG
ncbi:MAG: CRISPR-associated endonuclease Cas2 [Bryobacterales bacterium]|nr:CRISPR-associated endonuclease Cas2 [Bryobacteraceae bacterium]MDW8131913.1 CRISPR-associated endonuclease Cas2 [Bryobacterales bacterium]